jgi:predicted porin
MTHALRPIVAAALACTSFFACAQSSVTLYGLVDAALDISNNGSGTVRRLQSGGTYGSRWGLKGKEDLGGGLGVIFQLESGFDMTNGSLQQGGRAFGRHSWVGFSSPYGELTFGRQLSPQYYSFLYTDAFQLGYSGGLQALTKTNSAGTPGFIMGAYVQTGRQDASVNYPSPVWNGFSTRLMYTFSNSPLGQSHGGGWSGNARYNAYGFDLNAGVAKQNDTDGAGNWHIWSLGGSYQFGRAKIFVGRTKDENSSASTAAVVAPTTRYVLTNLGVRYLVGPSTTLIAQAYRVADRTDSVHPDRDATVFAIGIDHELSKRTALYASFGTVGNRNGSRYSLGGALYTGTPTLTDARAKTLNMGVRHWF